MKQLQDQGGPKLKNEVEAVKEEEIKGHNIMNLTKNCETPTGPVPEKGFHETINNFKLPA
eukprot:462320-Prorocentrum_lima.AAC.1